MLWRFRSLAKFRFRSCLINVLQRIHWIITFNVFRLRDCGFVVVLWTGELQTNGLKNIHIFQLTFSTLASAHSLQQPIGILV